MKRFHILEGEHVILRQRGVFKQAELYLYGENELFAKNGTGFVRLTQRGTSVPTTHWEEISVPFTVSTFGHLHYKR